ncbi:MAG: DUF3524 domain-containing protein [Opitutales bacterium]
MRVLLLSAYHSASHRYWCDGLMRAFPEVEWTLKTQPARHFSWRVRSSGWLWALDSDPDFRKPCDLILATSLAGVVPMKAMCPALQGTPLWVYFHENQFAHPLSERQHAEHQAGWQFQSLQNAFCADWISFNTAFNRTTFLEGARRLLRKFPEKLPEAAVQRLSEHSDVLPVPLTREFKAFRNTPKTRNLILWNHRWEWDKQPERFLAALIALHREGFDFELAMLGSGGGRKNKFEAEAEELKSRIVQWGEVDPDSYKDWIARADLGVSTAIHDFQGLSMLELAQAGATVIVPKRLAYPECLPQAHFYEGHPGDAHKDIEDLKAALTTLLQSEERPRHDTRNLPEWERMRELYHKRLARLAGLAS